MSLLIIISITKVLQIEVKYQHAVFSGIGLPDMDRDLVVSASFPLTPESSRGGCLISMQ